MTGCLESPLRAFWWFLGSGCEPVQWKEKSVWGVKGRALRTRTPARGGGEGRVAVQANASCEGGDGVTDTKGGVVKTAEGVSWLRVMQIQVWDRVGMSSRGGEGQVWCKSCV